MRSIGCIVEMQDYEAQGRVKIIQIFDLTMLPEAKQKLAPATIGAGMPNFVVNIVTVGPLPPPFDFTSTFLTRGELSSRSTPFGLILPDRIFDISLTIRSMGSSLVPIVLRGASACTAPPWRGDYALRGIPDHLFSLRSSR